MSIIIELVEILLIKQMRLFFETNNILNSEFGFHINKSTSDTLMKAVRDIIANFESVSYKILL